MSGSNICGTPTTNRLCPDCSVADRNGDTARSLGDEPRDDDGEVTDDGR